MSLNFEVQGSYYGGFIRFDSNGNKDLLRIFSSNTESPQATYFQSLHILSYINSSIILNGVVVNASSKIGYSNNSSTDQIIFNIDKNGDVQWTTVLDYNSGYDFTSGLTSYDSYIYVGMFGDNLYPWFTSLNGIDGSYIQSKWFTFFDFSINDEKSNTFKF